MSINPNIALAAGALVSAFSVAWIFRKILKLAKLKSLVDNPEARKLQKAPVPVLGGIAVFFGLVLGTLCYTSLVPDRFGLNANLSICLASIMMLFTGAIDDMIGLTPRSRIAVEIVAMLGLIFGSGMCIDSLHGLWGIYDFSWWIAVPLTVFAGVGLINAYNMIDGVNGLSSGLCIMSSAVLGVMFWKRQDMMDCALATCFAASLIPFFMHNVFGKRSKMFIGDAGTMVMGMLVAWFCIRVLSSRNVVPVLEPGKAPMGLVAMMISIASVPVADTLRVMGVRVWHGSSPFAPDRTHLHHYFIRIGISQSVTTLVEILLNVLVILIWYISYKLGAGIDQQFYITVLAAAVLVWGTYLFFRHHFIRQTGFLEKLKEESAYTHFGHRPWWLKMQRNLDKGAFEDFATILIQKFGIERFINDQHLRNVASFVNFIQGRGKVSVGETANVCRIEPDEAISIANTLESYNIVHVVNRGENGEPHEIKCDELWKDYLEN